MAVPMITKGKRWSVATNGGFIFTGIVVEYNPVVVLQGVQIRLPNGAVEISGPTVAIPLAHMVANWEG